LSKNLKVRGNKQRFVSQFGRMAKREPTVPVKSVAGFCGDIQAACDS
jgi:hypothetical protein